MSSQLVNPFISHQITPMQPLNMEPTRQTQMGLGFGQTPFPQFLYSQVWRHQSHLIRLTAHTSLATPRGQTLSLTLSRSSMTNTGINFGCSIIAVPAMATRLATQSP